MCHVSVPYVRSVCVEGNIILGLSGKLWSFCFGRERGGGGDTQCKTIGDCRTSVLF